MKRITDITQLHEGDRIVRVENELVEVLEFLCVHPHNDLFSIFLNQKQDNALVFLNFRLEKEEWFEYQGTQDDWDEIHDIMIVSLLKRIKNIKTSQKKH